MPEQVRIVRYEDLVRDTEAEVRGLCAFLELTYDPAMLAIEQADPRKIVPDQAGWFPGIFDGISTASAGRWQREMSRREQQVFAALAADELAACGYPVPDRPLPPPSRLAARIYHRHNEVLRDVNFIRLRVFQERGRELRLAARRRLRDPQRRR